MFDKYHVDIPLISSMVTTLVFIPFQERLLVLLSLSTKWEHSYRDTLLFRNGEGMSALDFMKSDDTSNLNVTTQAVLEGENGVLVRTQCARYKYGVYDNVLSASGFVNTQGEKKCYPHVRKCLGIVLVGSEPVKPELVDLGGETNEESQDDVIASILASEVVVTSNKSKKVVAAPSKLADSKTEDTFPRLTADMKGAVYVPD
ncbi:hypothetical protein Hanom_Chr11g00977981 [Helianthus anomalus]